MNRVSVIVTVLDEEATIAGLFDSLAAQSRPPDEVVVVDGGSRDRTVAILRSYQDRLPIRLLVEPGANISRGRNCAIMAATGDLIAVTDAGVRLAPAWLAELSTPFAAANPPDVVAGFFVADPQSAFELAMGATALPDCDEIDPARFLPSSRSVAFRRQAWAQVGGYPEWLDYCEDLVFDLALRQAGCRFGFAPKALVHFRPRSSLPAFARQYYRYARGDGKADLWLKRHLARYSAYVGGLVLFVAGWAWPPCWLLLAVGGLAYLHRPFVRLRRTTDPKRQVAALLIPIIRLTGDLAKMAGYPVGCWWRWRRSRLCQDRDRQV